MVTSIVSKQVAGRITAVGGSETGVEAVDPVDTAAFSDLAGLYGPDSEAWRLNREAVLLLGAGPRALLMQIAHPLVAEGVDQHSDFRIDPWGRLQATLRSYLTIVYGSAPTARGEIRRLGRLHRAIVGPVRDPAAAEATGAATYSARDPALSLWVHATLVDSTIVAHDAWIEPLSRTRREAFYAETRPIGRAFGVPERLLPPDLAAFEAYLAAMLGLDGPVHPTPTSSELARTILRPPLAPLAPMMAPHLARYVRRTARAGLADRLAQTLARVPVAAYDWTVWPAVALLPAGLREEFGIAWGPDRRLVAAWLAAGFRGWRRVLPPAWRQMPLALAADRRMAAADAGIVAYRAPSR
ncbi:MAG: oxygenase MpaB family protein [Candidatus Limnocylindrales bacterium]